MSGIQPSVRTVGGITFLELDGFSVSLFRDEIDGRIGVDISSRAACDQGHDHNAKDEPIMDVWVNEGPVYKGDA